MQLKQLGVTLALAGMLSMQAYAHEAVTEAAPLTAAAAQEAPANVLTQDDLVALFGAQEAGKPLQLAVLSEQEMRETEGALWPRVVYHGLGGLAGMYGGGYGYLAGGGRSPTGFLVAAGGGFAAGAWSPVSGFRTAASTFGSSFTGGAIGGWASRRGW